MFVCLFVWFVCLFVCLLHYEKKPLFIYLLLSIFQKNNQIQKRWVKEILNQLKDEVTTTSTCGYSDIALFMIKVMEILKNFYKYIPDMEKSDLGKENIRIIEATAKVIKSDTKMVKTKPVYPSLKDIKN